MPTLKESTEKLVAATERLLQDYKMERSARKAEEENAHAQIKDLKEQLTALQNKYESAVDKYEVERSAREISSPNPTIQSHETARMVVFIHSYQSVIDLKRKINLRGHRCEVLGI